MGNNLGQSGEDYLEAIFQLQKIGNEVRSVDVANSLKVSRAGVSKYIAVLKENGFVNQERYGLITLTEKGYEYAENIAKRHETIKRFLVEILGIDEKIADEDACKMEHAVSRETMTGLTEYLKKII